jgi:hypothetical protein
VIFDSLQPAANERAQRPISWTVRGVSWGQKPSRYVVFGPGASRKVEVSGNTVTIIGVLPPYLRRTAQASVSGEAAGPDAHDKPAVRLSPQAVRFSEIRSPEVYLSSLNRRDIPEPVFRM